MWFPITGVVPPEYEWFVGVILIRVYTRQASRQARGKKAILFPHGLVASLPNLIYYIELTICRALGDLQFTYRLLARQSGYIAS